MKKIMIKATGWYLNFLAVVAPKLAARKGFNTFCTPFAPPLKDFQQAFLSTAERIPFVHDAKEVAVYKWGNGITKVFLAHGWASNSFRWKKLVEQLQLQDCTIYSIDAPAHGNSVGNTVHLVKYHECVVSLIKNLGTMDAYIGHSIGGLMLLYTMNKQPELKSGKLVMMGAPGEATDFLNFYKQALSLTQRTVDLITSEFVRQLQQEPAYFSSARMAQHVTNATLIIHDRNDNDTNYQYSERLHQIIPNSKLIITEGLGHALKAPWINDAIIDFIWSNGTVTKDVNALSLSLQ